MSAVATWVVGAIVYGLTGLAVAGALDADGWKVPAIVLLWPLLLVTLAGLWVCCAAMDLGERLGRKLRTRRWP